MEMTSSRYDGDLSLSHRAVVDSQNSMAGGPRLYFDVEALGTEGALIAWESRWLPKLRI